MSRVAWPLTIYADQACPLCRAEIAGLCARDAAKHLVVRDCSAPGFADAEATAAGLDQPALLHRLHARAADGTWLRGVPVFAAMYEAAGLRWVAALLRVRWLRPLLDAGYALVATHRPLLVALGGARLMRRLLPGRAPPPA